jgi:hypothetical protein
MSITEAMIMPNIYFLLFSDGYDVIPTIKAASDFGFVNNSVITENRRFSIFCLLLLGIQQVTRIRKMRTASQKYVNFFDA